MIHFDITRARNGFSLIVEIADASISGHKLSHREQMAALHRAAAALIEGGVGDCLAHVGAGETFVRIELCDGEIMERLGAAAQRVLTSTPGFIACFHDA